MFVGVAKFQSLLSFKLYFFVVLIMHSLSSFFSLKKDVDLRKRTFQAMNNLEDEIMAMHSLQDKLHKHVNDSVLDAIKLDNKEFDTYYKGGYENLVNLLDIVKFFEKLLEILSVKMDTTRYLQEFVNILESAICSANAMKSNLVRSVTEVDSTLEKIRNSIMEIKTELNIIEPNYELPAMVTQVSIELPSIQRSRIRNNSAINLTTFATAVHTHV